MVWDAAEPTPASRTGKRALAAGQGAAGGEPVAGQLGQPDSVLEFYRAMLRLRRDTEELRTGRTVFFDVAEPVLAFTRGGSVLCLFNLSPGAARGPR